MPNHVCKELCKSKAKKGSIKTEKWPQSAWQDLRNTPSLFRYKINEVSLTSKLCKRKLPILGYLPRSNSYVSPSKNSLHTVKANRNNYKTYPKKKKRKETTTSLSSRTKLEYYLSWYLQRIFPMIWSNNKEHKSKKDGVQIHGMWLSPHRCQNHSFLRYIQQPYLNRLRWPDELIPILPAHIQPMQVEKDRHTLWMPTREESL